MVRINLEAKAFSDHRFQRLMLRLGDRHRAIGMLVDLWVLAQKHWIPSKQLIPAEEYQAAGLGPELVECGLAEGREGGIYARGSEEHFAWWFEKSEAGKRSAAARQQKHGTVLPFNARNRTEQRSNTVEQTPNTREHTRSSSSSSSSCSSSEDRETQLANSDAAKQEARMKFDLDALFAKYPNHRKRTQAQNLLAGLIRDDETYLGMGTAIDNYAAYCRANALEHRFIMTFPSFFEEWRDWIERPALKTGSVMNRFIVEE